MCVEEEGDGKAIGGGINSIIHQLMYQTALPIYLSLQGAERLDVFLSTFFSLASILASILS